MSYAATEVRALLARGPQPDEGFYRLKATGNGETKWVNVSPEKLEAIAAILDDELDALIKDHGERIARLEAQA